MANFEAENLKQQGKYSESRADADKLKADVDNLERIWQTRQQEYDQARSAASR
jgi:hypothetical protein